MKNLFVLIILISVFSPAVKAQIQVSGPSSIECGESAIYAVNVLPDYCICDLSVSIVGGVFCGTNSSQ